MPPAGPSVPLARSGEMPRAYARARDNLTPDQGRPHRTPSDQRLSSPDHVAITTLEDAVTPTDDRTCSWCGCPAPGQEPPTTGPGTLTPIDPLADLRVPVRGRPAAPLEPVAADLLCVSDWTGLRCDLHRRPMSTCRALIRRLQGG